MTGLGTAPEIVPPDTLAAFDAFDWLAYGTSLVTAVGAGTAWAVAGGRKVHEALKSDSHATA